MGFRRAPRVSIAGEAVQHAFVAVGAEFQASRNLAGTDALKVELPPKPALAFNKVAGDADSGNVDVDGAS